MMAIVIFAVSVTVCDITTFNLPKWSQFESQTFKKWVKVMSYNVADYVVG